MSELTARDRELVALGAAMGSNCVPCIEYHIPESRKAGLTDADIHAAIQHADRIRQVPARKTLQTALNLLSSAAGHAEDGGTNGGRACDAMPESAQGEPNRTAQPRDMMMGMMSKMMDACGSYGRSASAPNSAENKLAAKPATSEGCGCG
jgi:4-carboxymuconolactone decarboxylase